MTVFSLPIWAVFLLTAVLLFIAFEIGHLAGRRRRSLDKGHEQEELGSLVGAMLGLLGFILAIAFGAQLSRFDASKSLLLDEATAIYELFLRTDMLPPDARSSVRRQLQDYIAIRLDTDGDTEERIRQSMALQQSIWKASIDAGDEMPDAFPKELYFESLNDLINVHQRRVTVGLHQRMPGIIWVVLYLLAFLAFAVTGYHGAVSSSRRSAVRPIAVLAFALLVALIDDLDHIGTGLLQLNESALKDVSMRMQSELVRLD